MSSRFNQFWHSLGVVPPAMVVPLVPRCPEGPNWLWQVMTHIFLREAANAICIE